MRTFASRTALTVIIVLGLRLSATAMQAPPPLMLRIEAQRPGPLGTTTLVTLQSHTVIEVVPSDLKGDALDVTIIEQTCVPAARFTLASGRTVVVPLRDIADQTIGQRAPEQCRPLWATGTPAASSPSGSLPSDTDAMATIRAECAKRYPTNFQMRNFCEEQQLKALEKLRQR